MNPPRLPPPRPAPDPLADEWVDLLDEPFVAAFAGTASAAPGRPAILRERVLGRVARSARQSRGFVTVRRKDAPAEALAPGVLARTLYAGHAGAGRPGEPRRVRLLELAPHACWAAATPGLMVTPDSASEWLLLAGSLRLQPTGPVAPIELSARDFHRLADGPLPQVRAGAAGATVYLREAPAGAGPARAAGATVRDSEAPWDDFAPGIRRRVLWTDGSQAALMYHALPGAQVPRHGHGHDEECLMLEGDIFLDDVLLRQGEYQLAPAGSEHGGVTTDTGLLLFAHGDLALDVRSD